MLDRFREGAGPYGKYLWMLEAFANEGIEEMRDAVARDPEAGDMMAQWFLELSMLFEWIGTGNIRGDLPDWLIPSVKQLEAASSDTPS